MLVEYGYDHSVSKLKLKLNWFHQQQGEQLHITPAESLEFVVMDFQKETLDIINLKNITEQVITYKVKTTAPEKYRVRPSTGERGLFC